MALLSLTEIIKILKKHILQIVALSLAVGVLSGYVVSSMQTYTCTLRFKYNHSGALEGLAPDGESKLDPYEIQNPLVIKAALENLGVEEDETLNAKGIRQDIYIQKVVTDLDKEVSESAALLGEKYDVVATEYEMKFSYDASLGDEFGAKLFSNIIKEYDEFLLAKYYNKRKIEDFAKIVKDSDADYIVISDAMSVSLDGIIETLDDLSGSFPDYRSLATGYTFADLSELYQNLREIQHAKYYGNIRAGNLAKDREMVIKGYQTKVKELSEEAALNLDIVGKYKKEILSFYDSYKRAGLYGQAERVQENIDSTNNKDQDVLDDKKLQDYTNTYDDIILSFVDRSVVASNASHSADYYNMIIDSYLNDNVSMATKKNLIAKNEKIMEEIQVLSTEYSALANATIDELFAREVDSDLAYLILPEVTADKPVALIIVFLVMLTFGLTVIVILVIEIVKKNVDSESFAADPQDESEGKVEIDTSEMDELHQLLYQQYLDDFSEFYLAYQPMISKDEDGDEHGEVYIRWQSPEIGLVAPGKILQCISEFGIFKQLNEWIVGNVCKFLSEAKTDGKKMPVIHINCPYDEISDFAIVDIIVNNLSKYKVPAENICLELEGKDVSSALEDIMLLEEMGIKICIDKFDNSEEDKEILQVVKPGYIKMSLDILNSDMYLTSDDDILEAMENMVDYFSEVVKECHNNGIKACLCGIEKKSQEEIAEKIGFDYKQGFLYGKIGKLS